MALTVEEVKAIAKTTVADIGLWMYWIVGTIIIFTISYVLYTRFNKQVAAILVFLVSMMALYYYYVKWIVLPVWSPPVGTCPDFMTKLGLLEGTKQFICSNTHGAYKTLGSAIRTPEAAKQAMSALSAEEKPPGGAVYTGLGLVLIPNLQDSITEATVKGFCSKLSDAGITWINLCEMTVV
jgi:hypothetical protein